MFNIINTALEAIETINYLSSYISGDSKYYVILVALIWFSILSSKNLLKIQIKFSFLNRHIY
jgi:hypothetical protein